MSINKTLSEENTQPVYPNYKKAAELLYISGFFGIGNLIWKYDTLENELQIFIAIIVLALGFVLAYVTSKGIEWFKYILLALFAFGLVSIPFIISDILNEPVVGIINIVQTILQIYALVLLFKIPKTVNINQSDQKN